MESLTDLLTGEIARSGPLAFSRFMEAALYHPELGYYRAARDPFGKEGDFFTASQLQPVFGRLLGQCFTRWRESAAQPEEFCVFEAGAGRGDLAEPLAALGYVGVDADGKAWPEAVRGVIFSNELFDALPVDVAERDGETWRELRVDCREGTFVWVRGEALAGEGREYVEKWALPETERMEIPLAAVRMMDRMMTTLREGHVVVIDYGYRRPELMRFPQGTLQAYRRHRAFDDVLRTPGAQDITAHVNFDLLKERAQRARGVVTNWETLQAFLLRVGEADQFEEALRAESEKESMAHRLQLKTLLFGMGETFRVLTVRK